MGGVEGVKGAVAEAGLAVLRPLRLLLVAVPGWVAHARRVAVRLRGPANPCWQEIGLNTMQKLQNPHK